MFKVFAQAMVLLWFSAIPALGQGNTLTPKPEKFHLYLLAGQSNMAGRGSVEEQDREPHPRVVMLTKNNEWQPAVDPMHFDKSVAGVGLGKTFGAIIAEANPGVTIGLIPCAVGGSAIESWKLGGYHSQTKTHPYDDCYKRVSLALKDGTLKGILWHQGESDSNSEKAPLYRKELRELVERFRHEFNSPEVPFLVGQMGQFEERPWDEYRKQVDDVHRSLKTQIPRVAFVSSDGLGHRGDQVHFDSAAYRELGRRYAEAYLEMNHYDSPQTLRRILKRLVPIERFKDR
ncbi:sialate O-acetylesterase [Rhodopirellula sp.]|nr:sialate O-acetylesterase [Rhodopirellula sp.]